MAGDASNTEQPEQARVRLVRVPRDRHSVRMEGYRIIELPNDRNPEIVGTPREDRPQVFIDDEAYRQMSEHLAADLRYERGGLLFGYRNRIPQGRSYAEVTAFFPATRGHGTEVEFRIPNDDFAQAYHELERRGKREEIIGWVHSHPHHPPAPSEHRDFWIMENFLQTSPEQFTFITNPNTNQAGVFRWEEGRSVNQGGFILYGDLPNHGLQHRPRIIRTNSLSEREEPMVRISPDTFWQRIQNSIRSLFGKH